ncbi:MAG TPA: transposase [bacterium]|nr:transposase [bacterium]
MVQSLARVLIHVTFSTESRKHLITESVASELYPFISSHLDNLRCFSLSVGGHLNHVHILCSLYRTITIAKMVEEVKVSSSKFVKERFDKPDFFWQKGYAVFSVSESGKEQIINYIKNQKQHHASTDYIKELQEILKENAIPYSEQYLL